MKQTNNAIKFLMAQYRAIFQKAYIKGVLSAAVLTTGFSVGVANAAPSASYDSLKELQTAGTGQTTPVPITISQTRKLNVTSNGLTAGAGDGSSSDKRAKINVGLNITDGKTGTAHVFKITPSTSENKSIYAEFTGGLKIENNGKLIFGDSGATLGTTTASGSVINLLFKDVTVASGGELQIHAQDAKDTTGKSNSANSTTIKGETVTVTGTVNLYNKNGSNAFLLAETGSTTEAPQIKVSGSGAKITLDALSDTDLTNDTRTSRSVLGWRTQRDDSNKNLVLMGNDTMFSNGATLIMQAGKRTTGNTGIDAYGAAVWGNKFTFNDSKLEVKREGGRIETTTTVFNNSDINIAKDSTLAFMPRNGVLGKLKENGKYDYDVAYNTKKMISGTIDINGGTLVNDGSILLVNGGTLSISNSTKMTAGANKGRIVVGIIDKNSSGHSFDGTTNPTLSISSVQLDSYLNKNNETIGNNITDHKGMIQLEAGGRLKFTDTDLVDLSDFTFAEYSGDESNNNSPTYKAGTIIVATSTSAPNTDGTIGTGTNSGDKIDGSIRVVAEKLAVTDKLGASASALTLEANDLTLGNKDKVIDSGLNFKDAYAKNVTFVAPTSKSFVLKQNITLSNTREVTSGSTTIVSGESGSIKGNVTVSDGKSIIADGGIYTGSDEIFLNSGNLTVTNNKNADISSLTLSGTLKLASNQNNTIKAIGATGDNAKNPNVVLDLSDASFSYSATTASNKSVFEADKNAKIIFGSQIQDLLDNSGSNAAFFINGGTIASDGDISINAANFTSGAATNATDGKIVFSNTSGGTLDLGTNKLTLNATNESSATVVDIGTNSVVKAGTIALNSTKEDGSAQEVRLVTGTYTLQTGLASDTNSLVNVSGAKVEFGSYDANAKTVSTSGGSITTNLKISNTGTVNVNAGDWTAKDITIASGDLVIGLAAAEDQNGKDFVTKFSGDSLQMTEANSKLTVNKTGIADFGKFTSNGTVDVFGTLNINGSASADANDKYGVDLTNGQINVKSNAYLKFGTNATNDIAKVTSGTANVVIGSNKINLDNNGTIRLDYASGTSITDEGIKKLKQDLLSTSSFMDSTKGTIKGFINLGGATLDIDKHLGTEGTNGAPSLSWEKYESFADIDRNQGVTNDKLSQAVITGITSNANIKGSVGSLRQEKGVSSGINIAGNTALNNSASNNGHFATNADGKDADLAVKDGSYLTLSNGGIAGKITLSENSSLNTSGENETFLTSVSGASGDFNVQNKTSVKEDVTVKNLEVTASLSATNATVNSEFLTEKNSSINIAEKLKINGDFIANGNVSAKTLDFTNTKGSETLVANNALVDVANLIADGKQVIQIGTDSKTAEDNGGIAVESSTGYLEVDVARLNGATLYADPDYGDKTTLVAINKFDPKLKANLNTDAVGVIDGHIVVGKNSAVGLGVDTATLQKVIAKYQNGSGSLNIDDVGSVLYIAENVVLEKGKQIVVNGNETAKDLASTQKALDYTNNGATAQADMGLSKNAAVLIDMNAFTTGKDNKTQTTAVKFDKQQATINAESGARIFLVGDYDATSKLNLFEDNDTDAAQKGVDLKGSNIEIRSENGLLYTVLEAGKSVGYDVQLKIDDSKVDNALADASNPLKQTIIDYHEYNTAAPETTSPEGSKATTEKQKYFNDFLNIALNKAGGASAAETANRLGVYAGGAQTALYTSNTTSEAIAGRMGIGAQAGTMNIADNNQGTALWLTPIYKNNESDGFSAEGHNYGVDIDMYGLALGADFTLNNGLRVGAMFNVGSGDADGKQVAQGVSNDFDYYGFGAYVGFTVNNFSVVGDLSYTVADNDVIANTAHGKVGTNFDSSAISLGATAQYAFTFNGVDVTPHAGLRFTSVDMDDYTVESELYNDVAKINSDRMNVFSMPIGVTISKDMVAGSWVIKPSFDLTLTGNFGDDTANGTTTWIGAEPFKTVNKTEVLDSFTYGATVGIAAKNGNFSIGLGANYTGSSNTDEYGINANLRFVF